MQPPCARGVEWQAVRAAGGISSACLHQLPRRAAASGMHSEQLRPLWHDTAAQQHTRPNNTQAAPKKTDSCGRLTMSA